MRENLVIILAGGTGSRLCDETPKQFLKIADKSIIEITIEKFEFLHMIDHIFIVTNPEYYDQTLEIINIRDFKKVKKVLKGGKTRQESSRIGVFSAGNDYRNVLIHDVVRPFVSKEIIENVLKKLDIYSAVNVAIPSNDTIIEIDEKNLIKKIPDRKFLRRVQTPQAFKLSLIQKAHKLAIENNIEDATDDCYLVLKFKLSDIYVINGIEFNIKITYPMDIDIAREIIKNKKKRV